MELPAFIEALKELADEATGLDMQVDGEFGVGPRDEVEEPYLGDRITDLIDQLLGGSHDGTSKRP